MLAGVMSTGKLWNWGCLRICLMADDDHLDLIPDFIKHSMYCEH